MADEEVNELLIRITADSSQYEETLAAAYDSKSKLATDLSAPAANSGPKQEIKDLEELAAARVLDQVASRRAAEAKRLEGQQIKMFWQDVRKDTADNMSDLGVFSGARGLVESLSGIDADKIDLAHITKELGILGVQAKNDARSVAELRAELDKLAAAGKGNSPVAQAMRAEMEKVSSAASANGAKIEELKGRLSEIQGRYSNAAGAVRGFGLNLITSLGQMAMAGATWAIVGTVADVASQSISSLYEDISDPAAKSHNDLLTIAKDMDRVGGSAQYLAMMGLDGTEFGRGLVQAADYAQRMADELQRSKDMWEYMNHLPAGATPEEAEVQKTAHDIGETLSWGTIQATSDKGPLDTLANILQAPSMGNLHPSLGGGAINFDERYAQMERNIRGFSPELAQVGIEELHRWRANEGAGTQTWEALNEERKVIAQLMAEAGKAAPQIKANIEDILLQPDGPLAAEKIADMKRAWSFDDAQSSLTRFVSTAREAASTLAQGKEITTQQAIALQSVNAELYQGLALMGGQLATHQQTLADMRAAAQEAADSKALSDISHQIDVTRGFGGSLSANERLLASLKNQSSELQGQVARLQEQNYQRERAKKLAEVAAEVERAGIRMADESGFEVAARILEAKAKQRDVKSEVGQQDREHGLQRQMQALSAQQAKVQELITIEGLRNQYSETAAAQQRRRDEENAQAAIDADQTKIDSMLSGADDVFNAWSTNGSRILNEVLQPLGEAARQELGQGLVNDINAAFGKLGISWDQLGLDPAGLLGTLGINGVSGGAAAGARTAQPTSITINPPNLVVEVYANAAPINLTAGAVQAIGVAAAPTVEARLRTAERYNLRLARR